MFVVGLMQSLQSNGGQVSCPPICCPPAPRRFDLDYTLAQYRPETFERLAHTETVKKLISSLGYPKAPPLLLLHPTTAAHTPIPPQPVRTVSCSRQLRAPMQLPWRSAEVLPIHLGRPMNG